MEDILSEFSFEDDYELSETEKYDQQLFLEKKQAIASLKVSEDHIQEAWRFFKEDLGSPLYWCAPMVGASELAFRMMVRKYGTHIATTPMIAAGGFVQSTCYRERFKFIDGELDRPLIVQFCANRGDSLLEAVKMVEDKCDAVEINLGCPQQCANSGNYGDILMNSPEILYEMVSLLYKHAKVPVLCKVRIFSNYEKTLRMCELLQNAGCSILTVHGRTKEQKRSAITLADWNVIKKLKEDLRIPVISNGNIQTFKDVQDCLEFTKTDGVMSACALLANPALFSNQNNAQPFELAHEYLEFAEKYGAAPVQIRKHIFSILRRCLNQNPDYGTQINNLNYISREQLDFPHIHTLLHRLEEIEKERRTNHMINKNLL